MILFGINPLTEALNSSYRNLVKEIIIDKDIKNKRIEKIVEISSRLQIKIRFVGKNVLNSITKNSLHQGVAFEIQEFPFKNIEEVINDRKNIVLCDLIQDPHNLGSIARNALLFGFESVVITKDRSVGITPTVVKVSSGAVFHLDIVKVVNLARTIDILKENGYFVIGLDVRGESEISQLTLVKPVGLVVGSEGEGIRELVKKKCSVVSYIKTTNKLDSLNASVATAIAMYEIFKKSIYIKNT